MYGFDMCFWANKLMMMLLMMMMMKWKRTLADTVVNKMCVRLLDEAAGPQTTDRKTTRNRGRYLVMGKKTGDRLVVNYVRSLDRQRSRQLSRAMRAMRRQTVTLCRRDGINAAFASASPPYNRASRRDRKKKDGGQKLTAESNNEMSKRGRHARKHRRRSRSQAPTNVQTET